MVFFISIILSVLLSRELVAKENPCDYQLKTTNKSTNIKDPLLAEVENTIKIQKLGKDLNFAPTYPDVMDELKSGLFGMLFNSKPTGSAKFAAVWAESSVRNLRTGNWYFKKDEKLFIENAINSPQSHPEFEAFVSILKSQGLSILEINTIWSLIFEGLLELEIKYQNCLAKAKLFDPSIKYLKTSEVPQYCSDPNDNFSQNLHFNLLVSQYEHLLAPKSNSVAFWSGGIAISYYARFYKGLSTLESTIIGEAINSLHLKKEWYGINSIWNELSRAFTRKVMELKIEDIHVYLRTLDPTSVLYRQELKQLQSASNTSSQIHYHLVYGEDDDLRDIELDNCGNMVNALSSSKTYSDLLDVEKRINLLAFRSIEIPSLRASSSWRQVCVLLKSACQATGKTPTEDVCEGLHELEFARFDEKHAYFSVVKDNLEYKEGLVELLKEYLKNTNSNCF
jgi:hypothetical protein